MQQIRNSNKSRNRTGPKALGTAGTAGELLRIERFCKLKKKRRQARNFIRATAGKNAFWLFVSDQFCTNCHLLLIGNFVPCSTEPSQALYSTQVNVRVKQI